MKNFHIFYFLLFFNIFFTQGQYVVKSNNILNPDVNIDFVRSNVQFWIDHAYDPINGGFFSNVDRFGNVTTLTDVHTNKTYKRKSLIAQTRQGYGFTRAFMLTGDESYLNYAQSALKFLTDHGWDSTNEGWYCFAKEDGSLDHGQWWDPNNTKWGFQQQYALLGLVANYEATHDSGIKTWIDKGINSNYNHLWDSRTGLEGYYENSNLDWTGKDLKGFTCTVDAITTNAELSYLISKKPEYKTHLFQLGDIIVNRFVPLIDETETRLLYPEVYSSDWVPDLTAGGSIGHFLKTAWCLGRLYLIDPTRTEYKVAAEKILSQAWTYKNGNSSIWDHVNGGPFFEINVSTGLLSNDSKEYWTLEQGFTGPMINYYITKNPIYLQMADESISFFMNHNIDNTYGETYGYLDPTGSVVRNDTKGDDFKANYHCVEFAYYSYLYSNLYYLHQPASLYYKFAPQATAQTIELSPIPMENGLLRIKSVTLDGNDFSSFDATTRTLNIAANQGGKFKVTFESIDNASALSSTFENNQIKVYPNPTSDKLIIDGISDINSLSVLDVTGKQMLQLNNAGKSSTVIDIQQFNKGVYFVQLRSISGAKTLQKIIKK